MKRHQEMVVTIIVLGLACAVQSSKGRELPESLEQFAAEQHQQIFLQGMEARQAIRFKLKQDYQQKRLAFMESQGRMIRNQGRIALASVMEDIRGNGINGPEGRDFLRLESVAFLEKERDRQPEMTPDVERTDQRIVRLDELNAWTQPKRTEAIPEPVGVAGHSGLGS